MHDGVVYMADQEDGLRAWTTQSDRSMVAQHRWNWADSRAPCPPTSLAVDLKCADPSTVALVVGFEDGSFRIMELDLNARMFVERFSHEASSNGVVSAVAMCLPYVLTMSATQLLSLYHFKSPNATSSQQNPPQRLHSLKSHTVWPPLTVSLRTASGAIFVTIAYTLPTYLSGFTVGVQEVRISLDGKLLESRISSAIDHHYRPLAFSTRPTMHHIVSSVPVQGMQSSPGLELRHIHSKPTSISYTHPYLLVSHPDNTLTLYLVTSNADTLAISPGSRLWGHTSAVSGAHVGGRGKAISISRRGDELRVWELEGGFTSSTARKRLATGDLSVQIRPDKAKADGTRTQSGLDLVKHDEDGVLEDASELTISRGWIGFDEENVVILKEHSQGKQALVVYDFT